MANLKFYRKRIASVNNTKKITRAMKLVSAAKLRRAQDAALAHRDYADRLRDILAAVAVRSEEAPHPLMQAREGTRTLLVLVTSDRGLCGGFNSNISRRTERWFIENRENCEVARIRFVGRKGGDYFKARPHAAEIQEGDALHPLDSEMPARLAQEVTDYFAGGEYDRILLVYNKFVSALTQEIVFEQLLPILPGKLEEGMATVDFLYEPARQELLEKLVPAYVTRRVGQAVYESVASEHGARMTAMDSATSNAETMIGRLTLEYNRVRQAAITTELMEIIGGAEALKG